MKETNSQHTTRFIQWINRYPGFWTLICTPEHENMNPQIMITLIKQLAKDSLHEIIFVLLMVHREKSYVKSALDSMYLDAVAIQWKNGQKDAFLHDLLDYLH